MSAVLLGIAAAALSLTVLGPAALAPADSGVLERVELVRVKHGYGLAGLAEAGTIRIATESCNLLGYKGLAIVEDCGIFPITVVDCQTPGHEPLSERGLVADVNDLSLGHRQAYLLLWKEPNHPKPTYANQEGLGHLGEP